jgi:outer membrane protein assembly factor BamA
LFLFLLLTTESLSAQGKHKLLLLPSGEHADWPVEMKELKYLFGSDSACMRYLEKELIPFLIQLGYLSVSIDSVQSSGATTTAWIFIGKKYGWGKIKVDSIIHAVVNDMDEWPEVSPGHLLNPNNYWAFREKLIRRFEDAGYPFARFSFDSAILENNQWFASLRAAPGPLYRIEQINNDGKLSIRKQFLEQYLGISSGDYFNMSKLGLISERFSKLDFLKETRAWDLTFLGTGAVINLHLDPDKSSRFNFIAGLMPSNQQLGGKLLLTGEADLDLKNIFNEGEKLLLRWQQIQVQSPRLQIAFEKPYLFGLPAGMDLGFNLLKKDSSFLTIDTRLGIVKEINDKSKVRIFLQQYSSVLINPDTLQIKSTARLPPFLDVRSTFAGFELHRNRMNLFQHTRRGWSWHFSITGGQRNIIRNGNIVSVVNDASGQPFNFSKLYDSIPTRTTQSKLTGRAEQLYPLGKQGVLKAGIMTGWLFTRSPQLNELFQIGGFKTIRGFDEESFYTSGFGVTTLEYRYLLGPVSYLYGFTDLAYLKSRERRDIWSGWLVGIGAGLTFDTRAGQFNLAYAVGKRGNLPFNPKESKIHFGIISLF